MGSKAEASKENGKKGGRPMGSKASHTLEALSARALLIKMFEEKREPIFRKLLEKAAEGDLGAVRELHDRVWGRAAQFMELTGKDGTQLIPKSDIDIQKIAADVAAKLKETKTHDQPNTPTA